MIAAVAGIIAAPTICVGVPFSRVLTAHIIHGMISCIAYIVSYQYAIYDSAYNKLAKQNARLTYVRVTEACWPNLKPHAAGTRELEGTVVLKLPNPHTVGTHERTEH